MTEDFKITFQGPFDVEVTNINYIGKTETINSFLAIDWEKYNLECFERQSEVLNYFYFFSVEKSDVLNGKSSLTVCGEYTYGDALTKFGVLFDVIYERLHEKTSRGFFGLGKEKTKMVEKTTHKEKRDKSTVVQYIEAFLDLQTQFLAEEINEQMSHTSRID